MRIEELLVEQQLDELGWNQGTPTNDDGTPLPAGGVAQGVNKTIGGVAKGLGAVAGGVAGAWQQAKAGYAAGKQAVGGTAAPAGTAKTPAAGGTAPAAGGTAPAAGGTAPAAAPGTPATAAAPTPAQQQQAAQQAKIGIGQINKIIPTLKTDQLNAIKKVIDQRTQALAAKRPGQTVTGTQAPAATPAATPAAATTGVQTQAPTMAIANPAYNPAANPAGTVNKGDTTNPNYQKNLAAAAAQDKAAGRTFESVEFHSKFLNQKI